MKDMILFHGHGEGDCGAVGNNRTELEMVKELQRLCLKLLEDRGVDVLHNQDTGYNNYYRNLTKGVSLKYKMGAVLHINAGGGRGSEIIVPINEEYIELEKEILGGLENIGYEIRGIKSRDYYTENFVSPKTKGLDWYKEIREAYSNGCSLSIIEVCFIDNKEDVDRFYKNLKKIAIAIVNPYLKEMGLEQYTESKDENKDVHYRVQVGYYQYRENAENLKKKLELDGYPAFIVEV